MKQGKVKIIRFLFAIGRSRSMFVFLNGFLLASMLYFYIEDSYEKTLFESLATYVREESQNVTDTNEALLLNSLQLTRQLGAQRAAIFGKNSFLSIKSSLIRPVTFDLMTGKGACGSYAFILSRLLNELNIPNRIIQMKVNGLYGGHILVEAKASSGWVILDGSYNLYFKKADGTMAGFEEVHNNWNYYSSQVPPGYDARYNYEAARYTNWDKIPVVMPLVQSILTFTAGKETARHFSLRTYFLRKYHLLFRVTECLYGALLLAVIRSYVKRNSYSLRLYYQSFFSPKSLAGNVNLLKPRGKIVK